jgi:predicted O-methyltransferase YrrM
MTMIDLAQLNDLKGFMDDQETLRLYDLALEASARGPLLEIGSYCGRSAVIMGSACRKTGGVLFSVDHHRGSEEQQPDQAYFDPDLFDERQGRIDTFPFFRQALEKNGLEDTVVPIVCDSGIAGRMWSTPLALVFIDGGHSFEAALADFLTWSPHIVEKGFLVIHDIFFDPDKGGQAPRQVYEKAIETGKYDICEMTHTLGVLQQK